MTHLITHPRHQVRPDDASQGGTAEQTIAMETVLLQASYSLGNDVHAFYTGTPAPGNCTLCAGRRTCAGNRSVQGPKVPRTVHTSSSIHSN